MFSNSAFQVLSRDGLGNGDLVLVARPGSRLVGDVVGQADDLRALRPRHGSDVLRRRLRRTLLLHAAHLPHGGHGAHGRLPELAGDNAIETN